jgi:hypothetical protein
MHVNEGDSSARHLELNIFVLIRSTYDLALYSSHPDSGHETCVAHGWTLAEQIYEPSFSLDRGPLAVTTTIVNWHILSSLYI